MASPNTSSYSSHSDFQSSAIITSDPDPDSSQAACWSERQVPKPTVTVTPLEKELSLRLGVSVEQHYAAFLLGDVEQYKKRAYNTDT
jgi:hypothetical protein